MCRRRVLAGVCGVLFVLVLSAASAKGIPELEISGGGIRGKVVITAQEVFQRVHGWIMGGDRPLRPSVLIGPTYVLDVYTAVENFANGPFKRQPGYVRWTYYSKSGGH